jgi:CubicO group peptidase (beta-lactamase class C family)
VTRRTGAFYGEFLRQQMFRPLGMRTARIISDSDIVPHRAAGYVRTPSGLRNQDFVSASLNATADGSLYLSLDDWSAWIAAMDRGALLSRASWNALWERTKLNDGQQTDHGFCFDRRARGARVRWDLAGLPFGDRARSGASRDSCGAREPRSGGAGAAGAGGACAGRLGGYALTGATRIPKEGIAPVMQSLACCTSSRWTLRPFDLKGS